MFTTRKERDQALLEIHPDIKLPEYDPIIDKVDLVFQKILTIDLKDMSYYGYFYSWLFKPAAHFSDVLLVEEKKVAVSMKKK